MPGIGNEAFLLFVAFDHWLQEPIGEKQNDEEKSNITMQDSFAILLIGGAM